MGLRVNMFVSESLLRSLLDVSRKRRLVLRRDEKTRFNPKSRPGNVEKLQETMEADNSIASEVQM